MVTGGNNLSCVTTWGVTQSRGNMAPRDRGQDLNWQQLDSSSIRHFSAPWLWTWKLLGCSFLLCKMRVIMCACSVTQSRLILCHAMDCSPPGSSAHGTLQARILEWVATSYSRESSQPRDRTHFSCVFCIGRQFLYHQGHLGSPTRLIGDNIV